MRSLLDNISPKDQFLESTAQFSDPVRDLLQMAKDKSDTLLKSGISISYYEASLINFFIKQFQCQKFVEFGTLTGFSAVSILCALQASGELWTFEKNESHATLAQEVFQKIDFNSAQFSSKKINLLIGDAADKVKEIEAFGPFDGVFIDGNKSAYLKYLNWSMENVKAGGIIIADNVFLSEEIFQKVEFNKNSKNKFSEKQINIMKEFNCQILDEKKFKTIFLPTSEGLSISIKI